MSKFKVGDRIRRIRRPNHHPASGLTLPVGTICQVVQVHSDGWVDVEFDGKRMLHNNPECFESMSPLTKIVVVTNGETTTARLYSGKELVKSAEAKCSPDDEFVFETGAAIALDRLLDREKKTEPEAPKFPKEQMQTGVFGLTNMGVWFVVVDDRLVYAKPDGELEGFDYLRDVGSAGNIGRFGSAIDYLVHAASFKNAESNVRHGSNIIWSRPGVGFK